jgi:hypothetical protein
MIRYRKEMEEYKDKIRRFKVEFLQSYRQQFL